MAYKYKDNPDYDKVRFSAYIPRTIYNRLEIYSAQFGIPKNAIYSVALGNFFSALEKDHEDGESLRACQAASEAAGGTIRRQGNA